ncbi:hypothetical protein JM93_00918 [Roseibium hamelinense]|uniref:Uncharacterized protein n=1 Tax=Roseibium hamelinense TaxID=150831 RepID=A0A562TID3_9HYPH|nr:hypothetical protein [Roseibium hamelinense]MTI42616.1 hypothetical protein [Roseibium hamelinense]TWI93362.1 hypothetical protein JM93_00918 [Roseibium hamelinense]
MIALEDIIGLSGLTEDEILALAEHEHLPEVAAAAMGAYLMHSRDGPQKIRVMIEDDIRAALARGDWSHAKELFMALRHFLKEHRDALQDA